LHARTSGQGTKPPFPTFSLNGSYGSWQAPFIITAVLLVFGAGVWVFWLNPEVSAIERTGASA
jgi:hypothetical protein